jgi:hypothetical protein
VDQGLQRLLRAYPEQLALAEPNTLLWRDGTRMPCDDGRRLDTPEARLDQPSLFHQMEEPYPRGEAGIPPAQGADPGRIRYEPFFRRMYGATPQEVEARLVSVRWLPHSANRLLRVTRVNGVNRRLQAVSEALERLPADRRRCAERPAGAYHWRRIAGTQRNSAHAYGIAVDLDPAASDYWRWAKGSPPAYRNRIPLEIVRVFEAQGFIWGGKWSHFDTMHFEYRPELLTD